MEWMSDNITSLLLSLFGVGSIGYLIVARTLDKRKYDQEVRNIQTEADIKGDEFWKKRYDVLQKEVENKDGWWRERYNTLYQEFQNERNLSNEIVKSFRTELNEMRSDYENQRELEKKKYDELMEQYRTFEEDSQKKELEYKQRISQLGKLVEKYEKRLER